MFLLGSSDGKATDAASACGPALWSLDPGPEGGEVGSSATKSNDMDDNLEDIYAGVESLVDATTMDHTGSKVVEEDDPLAEFEAWIASGAVQIVDKL